MKSLSVPKQLKEIMDEKTFTKSRLYQLDKSSYSLIHDLCKQVEFLVSAANVCLLCTVCVSCAQCGMSDLIKMKGPGKDDVQAHYQDTMECR